MHREECSDWLELDDPMKSVDWALMDFAVDFKELGGVASRGAIEER